LWGVTVRRRVFGLRFTERGRGDASDIDGQLVRASERGANESNALQVSRWDLLLLCA